MVKDERNVIVLCKWMLKNNKFQNSRWEVIPPPIPLSPPPFLPPFPPAIFPPPSSPPPTPAYVTMSHTLRDCVPEPVFLNVCGAQELIPRNEFRQPM